MNKIRFQPADSEGEIELRDIKMTTQKGHYIREWPLTYSSVQLEVSSDGNVNKIEGLGETLQLFAKNTPGEDVSVDWSVDYDSLATIDANGLLTTLSRGIVTIRAETKDGSGKIALFDLKVLDPTLNLIGFEHTNAQQGGGLPVDFVESHTSENRGKWATSRSEMSYLMIRRNAFDDWLETNMSDFKATYGSMPVMVDETGLLHTDDLSTKTYPAHHQFYGTLVDSEVNVKYLAFQSLLSKWKAPDDPVQDRIDNVVHFLNNCLTDHYPPSSGIEIGVICARPTQGKTYEQQYLDLQNQIEERTAYTLSFIVIDWPAQLLRTSKWNAGSVWSDTRWAKLATCKSYIEDSVGVNFGWSIVDTDNPTADQYKQRVKDVTQEYIARIGMPTRLSACMAWSALPDRVLHTDLTDNPAGNGQLCAFREVIDIMNGTVITCDLPVNPGMGDGSYPESTKIYPNPANKKLFIEIPENLNDLRATIVDFRGKRISLVQELHPGLNSIGIENLHEGMYFLHLSYNGNTEVYKIIKN
ncbi:MAG: T9SS type A sorting domain-containing protein [Bacteroidetes bacterium]|nr:T9SS type A sorting domain-containing protein [Bacteroidota bacterium]